MNKPFYLRGILSLIVIVFFSQIHAQDFPIGLKAGVNFASISVSEGAEPDGTIGFHVGAFTHFDVADNFVIQPELLVSLQGGEDANITYVNVPVVGKYFITDEFSAHAGLQFGIVVAKDDELDGFLRTLDVSVPLGVEYQITDGIGAGLRYALGVSDVSDLADSIFRDVNWFNRVLQVFVTVNLPGSN
ncbi:MAG: outer membrane beta-barrel protein [Bacteroidota bacterium]